MPAVDYDYNYYSGARKVNKTANAKRATNKVSSSVATTSNRKNSSLSSQSNYATRQSTKEQVRKAMYENPKNQTASTTRRTAKKNNSLDIPEINHGKKVSNNATVKSSRNITATKASKTNVAVKSSKNYTTAKSQNKKTYAKPAEMKLKKPELSASQKKKAKEKAVRRVKNVLYLACGFAIAFLICYRYSLIDEKFNQLEKIKKELATAQTVNEQIQADIDSQTDLSYIENYAKYQLGMQKPSNSQIVYVNVEKQDRILTPVTIEETSNETWLDKLYKEIAKFFE